MNIKMNRFGPSLLLAAAVASCTPSTPPQTTATPAPATTTPAAGAQGGAATSTAAGGRNVNSGIYTAAQASRGQQVFQANCSSCHTIAEFTGSGFQRSWSGRPLGDFHQMIATMMPQTAPGSLTAQQYTDVVAYILSANSYAAGTTELPTGAGALNSIMMAPAQAR